MTRLERLQSNGIRRVGSAPGRFRYHYANGSNVSRIDRARIKLLRIPPAWINVAINSSQSGMLQAVGTDAAGRWQYIYHENHIKKREAKKFERLSQFLQALPKMRQSIRRDLLVQGLGRERILACVLRILSTCFLRPGSQIYASEHGSYGVATLKPKHVRVKGDTVEFSFPGKRQVQQHQVLKDSRVATIVRELHKHAGSQLFRYKNDDGEFVDVTRRLINQHIKLIMGETFSAKDFRTWAGTLVCACALARSKEAATGTVAARKRCIVQAIKETAAALGNTPAVCRSSYVYPRVLRSFEKGKVIDCYFGKVEELINHRGSKLHVAEAALLRLLRNGNA